MTHSHTHTHPPPLPHATPDQGPPKDPLSMVMGVLRWGCWREGEDRLARLVRKPWLPSCLQSPWVGVMGVQPQGLAMGL